MILSQRVAALPVAHVTLGSTGCQPAGLGSLPRPGLRTISHHDADRCRQLQASSLRSHNQIVAHAHVHIFGSNSFLARAASESGSALGRITAKIVEPDPDISAAPTSDFRRSHDLTCARKTNFS